MLLDFRPHTRLRGQAPLDLASSVDPVLAAQREDSADLARVRVVCDWVQYRNNFREMVDLRPILATPERIPGRPEPTVVPEGVRDDDLEIAIDVRRVPGPR